MATHEELQGTDMKPNHLTTKAGPRLCGPFGAQACCPKKTVNPVNSAPAKTDKGAATDAEKAIFMNCHEAPATL